MTPPRTDCRFQGQIQAVVLAALLAVAAPAVAQAPPTPSVSPAARAAETPSVELRMQAIRPGLSLVTGAGGNVVAWSGPDGVVLVDSGLATAAPALLDLVSRNATGPVRFVINTHGHADHAGGNETFARRGAVLVGHESLREHDGRDPAVPASVREGGGMAPGARPILTTTDSFALHLNGDRLDAVHVANAHTAADIVLRWNEADVVALGDIYWSGQYPYIDVASGGSLAGMVAAVEASLARANARTIIVPGHGPISNRAELAAYRDMLVAVGRKVREAVENGAGLEQVIADRPTAEFDARYAPPGALVSADEFVRSVYQDLAPRRPGR
jgi:glyoxylase-like metal-dependent hydrolase (beta-lactamase superfamily II)